MTSPQPEGRDPGLADPLLENRLDAAAALARAEERIRVAAMTALKRWTDLVRAAVLGEDTLTAAPAPPPPDPNAVPALRAQWSIILTETVETELWGMLGDVFADVLGAESTVSARPWQEQHIASVRNRLVGVVDQTFDLIRDVVADGQAAGADIPTLRGLISDVLVTRGESTWASRAQTIARTESIGAWNGGQLAAWKVQAAETGDVREKVWLCLAGDVPVSAVGVIAAARRWYDGPLIVARTAQGRRVAVTPNHELLSDRGWQRAQDLREGDHLIAVLGVNPVRAPQVEQPPALLGEVVDAALRRGRAVDHVRRVPARVDFEGEVLADGEVEVVAADRELRSDLQPDRTEQVTDVPLMAADEALGVLVAQGSGGERLLTHHASLQGRGGETVAGSFGFGVLGGGPQHLGLGPRPDVDPGPGQDAAQRVAADSVPRGQREQAIPGEVFTGDLFTVDVLPQLSAGRGIRAGGAGLRCLPGQHQPRIFRRAPARNAVTCQRPGDGTGRRRERDGEFPDAFAGVVAADEVVEVQREWLTAHVYDLQTDSGWFTADGVITHNSTIDGRTRPDHYEADGQRVALDAMFVIGDSELDHPGDPDGPPEEVCNCRCSMLIVYADEETPNTAERQLRPADEVDDEIDARAEDGQVRAFDDPDAVTGPRAPVQQQSPPPVVTADAGVLLLPGRLGEPDDGEELLADIREALTRPVDAPVVPEQSAAATERRTTMPRKWVSDPYLAPFDEASGDGRIIKPGALHARELPLPLLFQESSGFGHEGSVVVGKIDVATFADGGITAAGEYLDDVSVAEAVGKATALAESGLGHVSVDLGAVTAELVDPDGNPVDWDDLFDAWEDGEDIVVLEQVVDGELIAVTQVATPAFASAKIRLAAALLDTAGVDIGIGDTVDVQSGDAGTVRGRVTGVDEASATVSVQPIDAAGADAGDLLSVAPGAVTVVIDVDEATEPAPTAGLRRAGVFVSDAAGTSVGVGDRVTVDPDAASMAGDDPDPDAWDGLVVSIDATGATIGVQPVDAAGAATTDPPVPGIDPGLVTLTVEGEGAPASGVVDATGTDVAVGDRVQTDLRDESGAVVRAGFIGLVSAVTPAVGGAEATVTVTDDADPAAEAVTVPAAGVTVIEEWEDMPGADLNTPPAALVAGLGPLRPKRDWFDRQPLTGPTAMTITADGQIFGHVAQWGQCHVGFANTCFTAPESPSDYAYFHVGEVVCEDGTHVPVGNMTLGPRHADERLGYRAAVEHYDSAAAGVGVARCYEDEFGIQFAGALTPGVTEEQLYDMRRCPVSGDWRKIGGTLDLIGVLSVNAGGYPTPRFATDDAGRTALTAAPGVPVAALEEARGRRRRGGGMSQRQVMDRLKAELRTELAAEEGRRRRLGVVAAAIRRDPRSRLAAAAARVDR